MRIALRLLALVLALGWAAPTRAEDPKPEAPKTGKRSESPLYTMWAKWKPGAWVRHANTTQMGEQTTKQVITQKLVEVTEEKVVIEMKITMEVAGQTMDLPASKMDFPRWYEEVKAPETPAPDKKPVMKEGEESVTVGGKAYACKTMETSTEMDGTKVWTKTWMSSDVPGGTVKNESKTESAGMKTTMASVLEAWGDK